MDAEMPNSVQFTADRIVGQVGVNRFFGVYLVDGDRITIGPVMSTLMAGPEEYMALETRFHRAIEGEHPLAVDGDTMVIGDRESGILLHRR